MSAGDTSAGCTDVERLGEFNEFNAGRIDTTEKHGYLETKARRKAALRRACALALFIKLDFQTSPMVPAN
jgi:hypothetical protein